MNDYFVRRASSANADVNPVWPIAEGKKGYAYYWEKDKQKRLYGLGQLYTDDRLTLLGLIMSNYSVRCKPRSIRIFYIIRWMRSARWHWSMTGKTALK